MGMAKGLLLRIPPESAKLGSPMAFDALAVSSVISTDASNGTGKRMAAVILTRAARSTTN